MKNLTCRTAAAAVGAPGGELPALPITAVVTDSQKVVPGCLFAAIAGNKHDGHDFIAETYEKGAVCALCERPVDSPIPQLVVPDTKQALGKLAAWYRGQFGIPVVGVTGSVGKTTAKEMIASVLSRKLCTHKTYMNLNNDLGVPMTLLGLREEHQAAVVEMGVNHFGEMRALTRMVRPNIAVFTLIGDAHLEFLEDRPGVLRAKAEILEGMGPEGVVIANGDDELLRDFDFGRRTVLFGFGPGCEVRALDVQNDGLAGTRCRIRAGEREFPVHIPAFGRHMVCAALMGAAAGMLCGLSDSEIAAGIAAYVPVQGRSVTVVTDSLTLVDDFYNANPTSAEAAVDSLCDLPGRRVCILGDMLELGAESAALHRALGVYAAERCALVIACGEKARAIAEGAGEKGTWFETLPELLPKLPDLLQRGDAVLVMASRRMKFEQISEELKKICL